jgi:hypothetical protein
MGIMTAVRSQVPVPPALPQPPQAAADRATDTVRAVAEPLRKEALRQPHATAGPASLQLSAADEGHEPVVAARAAAQAARDAYIRASIAAGVNPLPLP